MMWKESDQCFKRSNKSVLPGQLYITTNFLTFFKTIHIWDIFRLLKLPIVIGKCVLLMFRNNNLHISTRFKLYCINSMAYGTRKHNAAFTRDQQKSLSWDETIQFLLLMPISLISILILLFHLPLVLHKGLFPVGIPVKNDWTE